MAKKTPSQQRWLKRQHSDVYVKKAHVEGYRSRAAYKLKEIQDKYKLIKKDQLILDLGAAPGSWSQVVVEQGAKVIGIDLLAIAPLEGATFIQEDFRNIYAPVVIPEQAEGGSPGSISMPFSGSQVQACSLPRDDNAGVHSCNDMIFDGVLSDISPSTCGVPKVDHLKLIGMLEEMIELFPKLLKSDGFFVCKVFKGGLQSDLLTLLKQSFKKVAHFKPKSSRAESAEEYLIAQGYYTHQPS